MTGSRAVAFVGVGDTIMEMQKVARSTPLGSDWPVRHRSDIGTCELMASAWNICEACGLASRIVTDDARCRLCGEPVRVAQLTPEQRGADPPPPYFTSLAMASVRHARNGGDEAILHHGCAKTRIDDYWDALDWWACQTPSRPLDDHTRFDKYCLDCGHRWLEFKKGSTRSRARSRRSMPAGCGLRACCQAMPRAVPPVASRWPPRMVRA